MQISLIQFTQTINLLLKLNENVALKEELEKTFQLINYYRKKNT